MVMRIRISFVKEWQPWKLMNFVLQTCNCRFNFISKINVRTSGLIYNVWQLKDEINNLLEAKYMWHIFLSFFLWLNPTFINSKRQTIHSPNVPKRFRKRWVITTKTSIKGEGTYLAEECNFIHLPSHIAKRTRNKRTTR